MRIILLLVITLFAVITTSAQGISPLIQIIRSNHSGIARGTLSVLNGSLMPLVSTLQVTGFSVSEEGEVSLVPLPLDIHVTLSSSSVRVPPQSQSSVEFQATCPSSCQFLIMTSDSVERRVSDGISIKVILPETVYIEREPIRKGDITLAWQDAKTLLVSNNGGGFDRPLVDALLNNKSTPLPSIPLMPHAHRFIHFDVPPSKVTLRGEKFKLEIGQ